jgi:phospholipid/cholesterol/gamma-HCH transport system substrate-binding protein
MPVLRRGRSPRRRRDGGDTFRIGLVAAIVLAVLVYFGFTKDIPFTHGYRLKAVFETSNNIRLNSPVRIAGVNVGKVKAIDRKADTNTAIVTMEIKDAGLPIHKDAQVKIRPRIFLEGNFFVDLKPGTPSAPILDDGDTLPVTQSATPVQFDQILAILQSDTRKNLQETLQGLGDALNRKPSAADDANADPDVRGETAAQSLNHAIDYGKDALKGTALVNDALTGTDRDDVSKLLRGLSRTTEGLSRNERQLQELLVNFNRTVAATAAESTALRASVRELGPTVEHADGALTAVNAALPPTRVFAREILPGVMETPATVNATFPWIKDIRPLLSQAELKGLVQVLQPGTAALAHVSQQSLQLMRETNLLSRCVTHNVLPVQNSKLDDDALSTDATVSEEFWHALVGIAGEGQNFDGNGYFVRLQPGGGDNFLEIGGRKDPYYGALPDKPLGTRPAWPTSKPPYKPDVPCYTQKAPNLKAKAGPSDALGASSSQSTARAAAARGGDGG